MQKSSRSLPLWVDLSLTVMVAVSSGCGSFWLFSRAADYAFEGSRAEAFALVRLEALGKADYKLSNSESFPYSRCYYFQFRKAGCYYNVWVLNTANGWLVRSEDEYPPPPDRRDITRPPPAAPRMASTFQDGRGCSGRAVFLCLNCELGLLARFGGEPHGQDG